MIDVNAEGTRFDYLPARQVELAIDATWLREHPDAINLAKGEDTRLAFFRNLLDASRPNPYWLVWQSPKDLLDLDSRVETGLAQDADFVSCFRSERRRLFCPACSRRFDTLAVDAGDPYPDAPNLHLAKIAALNVLPCPACGGNFRQLVVKIISASHSEGSRTD